ncbi:MAG: phosphoglycerate dehydrogenase [Candidatus Levybacteria bacterium]|nr:phosphoglycerate dehydrogenase [Candidatus Levybacteria bacterium]
MKNYYIIDFDSTFIQTEAIDELSEIVLKGNLNKDRITSEIKKTTALGMEGKIKFSKSLSKRLSLLKIEKKDIEKLIKHLKAKITPSIERNKEFFKENRNSIYIISGGFKEYIYPVVKRFGVLENHILSNSFIIKNNKVLGFDKKNILSQENGKARAVKSLHLEGNVFVLGDGYTDFEIKKLDKKVKFVAFCENVTRENVVKKADLTVNSFDEFLFSLGLPRALSYPKSKMKVLLTENIDKSAVKKFKDQGYTVELLENALDEKTLIEKIKDVSILGVRSKTAVSKKVLENAPKLIAIGAFCIGTDKIDLLECTKKGIVVFNAPYSNTKSVVELTIAEIIVLFRNVIEKSNKLHSGVWDKSAKGSHEVRGKRLGIVGYGNIGTQLGIIAQALGMEVYFYDIVEKLAVGNVRKCQTLLELLQISDVIAIHVDGRKSNQNLIGEKEFKQMKDGVIFLNLSRGFIVDIQALHKYIVNGKIKGAAVDVFPNEPNGNGEKFNSLLRNLPNVILTPHIGGSTEEAQEDIGEFVGKKLIDFIDLGNTTLSVNFPNLNLSQMQKIHRLIHIHKNVPGVLAKINTALSETGANIENQILGTNDIIGCVITDINKEYSNDLQTKLKNIEETIKFRLLY